MNVVATGQAAGLPILLADNRRHRLLCRPGQPIRLHHLGSILPVSDSLLSGKPMQDMLLDALKRLCGTWAAALARLMERYFAFLRRRLEEALPEIERRLAPYEGLYKPEHTLFSAPALLPRIRIEQGELREIPVPAAMWSGEALTALFEGRVGETPKRSWERTGRLEAAGIAITMIAPETTAAEDDIFFDALLGPELRRFFETEPVPCGPLPPDLAPAFLTTRLRGQEQS